MMTRRESGARAGNRAGRDRRCRWTGPSRAATAKPNSLFNGVQIGTITYSFRSMPDQTAEATLKYIVDSGISAIELMGGPVERLGRARRPDFTAERRRADAAAVAAERPRRTRGWRRWWWPWTRRGGSGDADGVVERRAVRARAAKAVRHAAAARLRQRRPRRRRRGRRTAAGAAAGGGGVRRTQASRRPSSRPRPKKNASGAWACRWISSKTFGRCTTTPA